MPVLPLLGVLFVGLKLTGTIAWSWWWVTAPFWGGAVLALAFLLLFGGLTALGAGVFTLVDRRRRGRSRR